MGEGGWKPEQSEAWFQHISKISGLENLELKNVLVKASNLETNQNFNFSIHWFKLYKEQESMKKYSTKM